jgi:hypothetical protein
MKKITVINVSKMERRNVWIGKHIEFGFFLFDKKNQEGIAREKLRVYLFEKQRTSLFIKKIFREKTIKLTKEDENLIKEKVDSYEKSFVNSRVTHCYDCKEDINSIDFSICTTCKWIKCQCSACGCGYNKFYE